MSEHTNLNFTPNPTVKASSFELSFQATIKVLNSATLRLSLARTNTERSDCLQSIRACLFFLESDLSSALAEDERKKSCNPYANLS